MHVHSIPIVCLLSTSANNGLPKADFPAALSTPSDKPQMDTSGLERTKACYVSTALISGLSHSLPSPLCQKITTTDYWFRTSRRAHCVSGKTAFRNWDPFSRQ